MEREHLDERWMDMTHGTYLVIQEVLTKYFPEVKSRTNLQNNYSFKLLCELNYGNRVLNVKDLFLLGEESFNAWKDLMTTGFVKDENGNISLSDDGHLFMNDLEQEVYDSLGRNLKEYEIN